MPWRAIEFTLKDMGCVRVITGNTWMIRNSSNRGMFVVHMWVSM